MSDHVIESFETNGYRVDIVYDDMPSNPHDDDVHFLFLGFPHHRYNIGDGTIDPDQMYVRCEASDECDVTCEKCYGNGEHTPENWEQLVQAITAEYDALQVEKVGMIDHSGVSYYLGGGAHWSDSAGWDSGTCGVMVYTKAHKEMWGSADPGDEIREMMAADLAEYSDWANGNCQGYIIYDSEGEQVESCWGFIGTDDHGNYWAAINGRSEADALPSPAQVQLEWAAEFV